MLFLAARGGKAPAPEWVVMLVLGLSVLLAAIAVYLGLRVKKHLANATYAEGEVVGFIEQSEGRGGPSVAPVIRFSESDGTSHEVNSSAYSYPAAFELGDKIRVAYPPGKPHEAEYLGLFAQWGHVIILGSLAGAVAVMCLVRLWFFRGAA
ncbi:DUF3592 domain-containing protein [Haloferula sp. BvORR071]|uniref:DUF3592 domain-containing protein n=1 Tax=Haloferula sp. BvORR071 TaxID=1396141 RepID=UPI000550FD90|nr:DUF3592 domain-containing protein [Haloferula sp. BvORR071]